MALASILCGHVLGLLPIRNTRGSTPTSVQSLKLWGILVVGRSWTACTSLKVAHVWLSKHRLIVVCSGALGNLPRRNYLVMCIADSWTTIWISILAILFHGRSWCWSKIIIENYIVIVLLDVVTQVKVLSEEAHKLMTRPVVCNPGWLSFHLYQHCIKQFTSITSPLHTLTDIEVEDRKRFHFDHLTSPAPDEELLVSNFDKADTLCPLRLYEDNVAICLQLAERCYRGR